MSQRKKLKIILIVGLVIIVFLTVVLVLLINNKKKQQLELNRQIQIQQEQEKLAQEIKDTEADLIIETEEKKSEDADLMMEEPDLEDEENPEDSVTFEPQEIISAREIVEGDEVYNRIIGKSYVENPNVSLSDLRYLTISYYDFNHQVQKGEMIVNKAIADDVMNIFKELYDIEYEIYSMRLIDDFWTGDGDSSDTASCDANNTSSFCYREITGGGDLSNHAWGCAIDINPQQNPYVSYKSGAPKWSHENANDYIDRSVVKDHMIVEGDACYNIFAKYGFSWGGAWKTIKDYQHFEKKIH